MTNKIYQIFFFICIPLIFLSQEEHLKYRSSENPYYWKNKKPFEGYWQQDVHYDIKANLDDSLDIISGNEKLIYFNNSPHTLNYVFFHLYSNANAKGSYLEDLYKNNNVKLKFGKYRSQGLGTSVEQIKSNGQDLKTELDNTILKVYLNQALNPGESVQLDIQFKTYFEKEAIRNRMKLFNSGKYKHFDIVHWYPRISCYDRKFGWDTEQHMDHEFYGDFGSFRVEMTLPNNYIIDGTGELINENEVLPEELRKKLDISNFAKKQWESAPDELIPRNGTKTWIFSAINVHDVAYTADPTYRIGEVKWNGVRCIALAQESHAAGWLRAAQYVAKIIETNSKLIGMYAYPKMIAADAADGMEYPMLTLDGGYDPSFRSLFIHEISHNWFFGMLGSNETYRAFMDEGFTQFYSAYTWEHIEGKYDLYYPSKSKYVNEFSEKELMREGEAYIGYYNSVNRGEEVTLNTHSDGFNGGVRHGGGYSQAYTKTATMLYNLQYVLGDSLFDAAMQNYFDQWKMCHPYPEDMRASIINFTKVDLNWFFDQWLETSKTIDYSVKKVKKKNGNKYEITFERKGMQMPIDFTVFTSDSSAQSYHIPNNWFEKKTNSKILPRWIGWDKVKKTYTASIEVPGKITNVVIDTTNRLADINYTDNRWKKNIKTRFDSKIWNMPDRTHYELFWKPAIWYNGFDGMKFGINLNGNYLNKKNIFDFTIFSNTGALQSGLDSADRFNTFDNFSILANYKTSTEKLVKKSNLYANLKIADGLHSALVGFEKKSVNEEYRFYFQLKAMYRDFEGDAYYLLHRNEWTLNKFNNSIQAGVEHPYTYKRGTGLINLQLRSPMVYSDYDFSSLSLTCVNKNNLGRIKVNTRFFAQLGTGNTLPSESQLYVYGANPEEMMEDRFTRAAGILPSDWGGFGTQTNHLLAGGGLNLRGFGGYLLPYNLGNGTVRYIYKGTSGASFNTEIEFGEIINMNWRWFRNNFKLTPYIFADAGVINVNYSFQPLRFSNIMADAGVGCAFTIKRWWKLQTAKPFTVRFDMPLFINKLPYLEKDYVQFRWMVGINRAF
ncbi:MAG: M1 family aminopeptidase [Bacteroidota bacterium]